MKNAVIGLLTMTAVVISPSLLLGQVPDWYPWHDRVAPTLAATVDIDPFTGGFVYRYAVANYPGAEQRIAMVYMELAVPDTAVGAPPD